MSNIALFRFIFYHSTLLTSYYQYVFVTYTYGNCLLEQKVFRELVCLSVLCRNVTYSLLCAVDVCCRLRRKDIIFYQCSM